MTNEHMDFPGVRHRREEPLIGLRKKTLRSENELLLTNNIIITMIKIVFVEVI